MSDIDIHDMNTELENWKALDDAEVDRANSVISAIQQYTRFLQANPFIASKTGLGDPYIFSYSEEDWRKTNAALGTFEKESDQHYLRALKPFGNGYGKFQIRHLMGHEDVCERVVVGTRTVTKSVPMDDVEYTEIEVEEDIIEWKCPDSWR